MYVEWTHDFTLMDRNYVFTSAIISKGSVFFPLHLSAALERKEPNICVCVCVCAGSVTCVFPPREAFTECMCMHVYVWTCCTAALSRVTGCSVFRAALYVYNAHAARTYIQRHTLTYSPTQRGLLGWKPSSFSLKTCSCFVQFDSLCCPVKEIFEVNLNPAFVI